MMYYLGSAKPLPIVSCTYSEGTIHTEEIAGERCVVRKHFSLENVLYVGSDHGCGCGIVHSPRGYEGPLYSTGEETLIIKRRMESLWSLMKNHGAPPFVEFYGCWDCDQEHPPDDIVEIDIDELLAEGFCFTERRFYCIKI